jgi:hypothetical protein
MTEHNCEVPGWKYNGNTSDYEEYNGNTSDYEELRRLIIEWMNDTSDHDVKIWDSVK